VCLSGHPSRCRPVAIRASAPGGARGEGVHAPRRAPVPRPACRDPDGVNGPVEVQDPPMRNLGMAAAGWLVGSSLLAAALGRLIAVGQRADRGRYGTARELTQSPLKPL
jgi:hypothetical protein